MKRKSPDTELEELPLFDLPLRDKPARPRPAVEDLPAAAPRPKAPTRPAAATAAPPAALKPATAPAPTARRPAAEAQLELEALGAAGDLEMPDAAASAGKAGIGDRFFAGLADVLLHVVIVGVAALAILAIGHAVSWRDVPPLLVFALLFSFLYSVFSLAFWGQTPGMAWAGQLARSVTGEPLTFGQTALRWLGGLLTLALAGLPLLLALAGGRSLADRISDSKTLQL